MNYSLFSARRNQSVIYVKILKGYELKVCENGKLDGDWFLLAVQKMLIHLQTAFNINIQTTPTHNQINVVARLRFVFSHIESLRKYCPSLLCSVLKSCFKMNCTDFIFPSSSKVT